MDEVIGKLHDKKCRGSEGIDGPIVKKIHRILPSFCVTVMNKCLRLGCLTIAWKAARAIAIPKRSKTSIIQYMAIGA